MIYLVGYRSDDWFDTTLTPMLDQGYFDTLEEVQAWIAEGSLVQKEYAEEVERIASINAQRKTEYDKNVADWEAAQAPGLSHLMEEPVEYYQHKIDTYDEFARGWSLEPIPVERGA
ncbi:hypothetical protein SEA_BIG4_320 [Microbacterium phage Big4]|nr:hypothetical protein SEA_BIG4_320 [Microbacterium phage Big4]